MAAHTDTRAGNVDLALLFRQIDRLSLLSRSIDLLLDKNPEAAVFALREIPADLELVTAGCHDVLVPEPSRFYETLGHVVERGFTAEQRARGEHLVLAREYLVGVKNLSQVPPAAKFLAEVRIATEDRELLARDFAGAVARVPGSMRAFDAAMTNQRGLNLVIELADRLDASTARKEYVAAVRTLVARSLGGTRCDDDFAAPAGKLPDYVTELNARMFAATPITTDEARPLSHETTFEDREYWTMSKSAEALERFRRLRERVQNGDADADPAKWKLDFTAFLDLLRAWKIDDEGSDADFFVQRALMYLSLIQIAPDATTRVDAIAQWVTFARQNHNNAIGTMVWNGFITYLVSRAPKAAIPEMLDAYSASGDTTLQAYAGLQRAGVKAFPGL